MSLNNLLRCKHKLKEYKPVGENKAIMQCENCKSFFEFDYKELAIKQISIQE